MQRRVSPASIGSPKGLRFMNSDFSSNLPGAIPNRGNLHAKSDPTKDIDFYLIWHL